MADSAARDSEHHLNDSDVESDQDRGSSHHSDSASDHGSNPGLDSESGSNGSPGSGSNSSDNNGGNFTDMFKGQQKRSRSAKKPGRWKHAEVPEKPHGRLTSSSQSRSRETENQKRRHVASPENMPNPDKQDRKKKSDHKETPSKSHPRGDSRVESAQDKVARRLGEEMVQKYQAEEEGMERLSRPKKSKKGSSNWEETSATWDSSDEDDHKRRRRKKEKEREKKAKAQS